MALTDIQTIFCDIGKTLIRDNQSWMPGAQEFLGQMRAANRKLGVISNTDGLTRGALAPHLPNDFDFQAFDDELIVLSGEVGLEKPDIRIFVKAISQAQMPPWACLFIGENLTEILAAQRAGMRAARIALLPQDFEALTALITA